MNSFINFIHSLVIITAFRFFHICFYLSSTTFVAYHLLLVALLINPCFSFVRLFFSCCTRSNHKDQDCYWLKLKTSGSSRQKQTIVRIEFKTQSPSSLFTLLNSRGLQIQQNLRSSWLSRPYYSISCIRDYELFHF